MDSIPVQMANALKSFGVHTVYGDAREIEGTTVVPAAVLVFGFGGGGSAEDGGGGGGGYVLPIGSYVGDSLGVRFQPNPIAVLAVSVPLVWVTGKAIARIVRACKK